MSGPKWPPAESEEYEEDPDEDLAIDEPEDPDEVFDDNHDPRGDERP